MNFRFEKKTRTFPVAVATAVAIAVAVISSVPFSTVSADTDPADRIRSYAVSWLGGSLGDYGFESPETVSEGNSDDVLDWVSYEPSPRCTGTGTRSGSGDAAFAEILSAVGEVRADEDGNRMAATYRAFGKAFSENAFAKDRGTTACFREWLALKVAYEAEIAGYDQYADYSSMPEPKLPHRFSFAGFATYADGTEFEDGQSVRFSKAVAPFPDGSAVVAFSKSDSGREYPTVFYFGTMPKRYETTGLAYVWAVNAYSRDGKLIGWAYAFEKPSR